MVKVINYPSDVKTYLYDRVRNKKRHSLFYMNLSLGINKPFSLPYENGYLDT